MWVRLRCGCGRPRSPPGARVWGLSARARLGLCVPVRRGRLYAGSVRARPCVCVCEVRGRGPAPTRRVREVGRGWGSAPSARPSMVRSGRGTGGDGTETHDPRVVGPGSLGVPDRHRGFFVQVWHQSGTGGATSAYPQTSLSCT